MDTMRCDSPLVTKALQLLGVHEPSHRKAESFPGSCDPHELLPGSCDPHELLKPGCLIHWQAMNGLICGPACVEAITQQDGRTWAYVEFDGIERWVNEKVIVKVEDSLAR